MKTSSLRTIKLDIASRFDMLEMVQTVLTRAAEIAGFDDDAAHYLSVAVRESVVNAIKHGNKGDENKRVSLVLTSHPHALEVRVQDQGQGFDPAVRPRSAGGGEPAEGRRPRDLLHAAVHGRGLVLVPAAGRHGREDGQAGRTPHER